MEENLKNLVVAVLFAGSLSIFGAANAADGCGLVAIIRRMADVSSMAGIPAGSYGTSALPSSAPSPVRRRLCLALALPGLFPEVRGRRP